MPKMVLSGLYQSVRSFLQSRAHFRRRQVQTQGPGTTFCIGWQAKPFDALILEEVKAWMQRSPTTGARRTSTETTPCFPRAYVSNEPLPLRIHNTMSVGYIRN